eukprot:694944-Rhodomonas_salina.6
MVLQVCYTVPGSKLEYAATRSAMPQKEANSNGTSLRAYYAMSGTDGVACYHTCLRAYYAMSGTDVGSSGTVPVCGTC